jgi:anti-anti-sigma regulatory factor
MDIRISVIQSGSETLLKVDGTLTATRVPMLESTVATLEKPFAVDLSELLALDEDGLQALRRLREAGAGLRGLSPLIALQLGLDHDDAERR